MELTPLALDGRAKPLLHISVRPSIPYSDHCISSYHGTYSCLFARWFATNDMYVPPIDWVQDTATATATWGDIGDWDVSGVGDFSWAFSQNRDVTGGSQVEMAIQKRRRLSVPR